MVDSLTKEFSSATRIEKFARYAITAEGEAFFGFLGVDGQVRYFGADAEAISDIAAEIYELARAARHVTDGNPSDGFLPSLLHGFLPMDAVGIAPPLFGPRMKLLRAAEHLARLLDVIERYGKAAKLEAVEVARDGSEVTWELRLNRPPPGIIPLLIGDVVHNLRSALDIAVCDIARYRGLALKFKFPFADDEGKLKEILQSETLKIGEDVSTAILELKPFKNGNENLRGLHDLDIIDKHRVIIPTYFAEHRMHNMGRRVEDLIARIDPQAEVPKFIFHDEMGSVPFAAGERIVCPAGQDPLAYYDDLEMPLLLRFPREGVPFADSYVVETLTDLFHMVDEILVMFATKFGKPQPVG